MSSSSKPKSPSLQPSENSPLLQSQSSESQPPPSSKEIRLSEGISKCIAFVTPSQRNIGMLLVLSAEVVGASMDATARFLQQGNGKKDGKGISVFQVIFARMSITWLLSTIYLWYNQIPDFPFGNPKVRGLLALRALFGFLGLFCLYFSVHYLTISEATIIRFLVPLVTTILCSITLAQAFTRRDFIAGFFSLFGVVIMAHPASIFGHSHDNDIIKPLISAITARTTATPIDPVTPTTHLLALSASLLGVFFAAGAYTMIRLIGSRAHALISVSYFSALATTFTFLALCLHPSASISWILPADAQEWILLVALGVMGFVLQFLLTAGLQMDKSSRATSMLYLQVIFAGCLDFLIWGVLPGGWSLVGGGVVIASTLWLALGKGGEEKKKERVLGDEEGLISGQEEEVAVGRGEERRASVSA